MKLTEDEKIKLDVLREFIGGIFFLIFCLVIAIILI